MKNIIVPDCIKCKNVHCRNPSHIQQIDNYTNDVLNALDSVITTIATNIRQNNHSTKTVPGWSELVKPFCDDAKFWHAIWISAGKPLNTELHRIMKKTRNVYHYAIRKCKRAAETIIKDRLLENCAINRKDVFKELKKLRHVATNPSEKIDGNDNPKERFAEVYEKLYNSVEDSKEMNNILDEVEDGIDSESLNEIEQISADLISDIIKELKTNTSDPEFTFNSKCIKCAPTSFHSHLSNIIKCYLVHGHVSNILLLATIMPLVKDKLVILNLVRIIDQLL